MLDICEETFRLLDQLLDEVWDGGLDGQSRDRPGPPKQEEECVAVGALNLLKLQLFAVLSRKERVPPCLAPGTALLAALKRKVVELASNACVLETIQRSAQQCLQVGWSILIPTAEERARALSTLLPNSSSSVAAPAAHAAPEADSATTAFSPGRRFMTDLLVSSLMADGGLEAALVAAIKVCYYFTWLPLYSLSDFCHP